MAVVKTLYRFSSSCKGRQDYLLPGNIFYKTIMIELEGKRDLIDYIVLDHNNKLIVDGPRWAVDVAQKLDGVQRLKKGTVIIDCDQARVINTDYFMLRVYFTAPACGVIYYHGISIRL